MEADMIQLFTKNETRELEALVADRGVSYLEMMETAGNSCAEKINALDECTPNTRICFICGGGGNGGDGYVAARVLCEMGHEVEILQLEEPKNPDCAACIAKLPPEIQVHRLPNDVQDILEMAVIVVDAAYGTGFVGELPQTVQEVFEIASKAGVCRVSLDLPSGVNANEGSASKNTFPAEKTIAVGCYKVAHFASPACNYCGEIQLATFGETASERKAIATRAFTIEPNSIAELVKNRDERGNKGTFGNVMNFAGSDTMCGAAVMSTRAALRSGAGIVRAVVPKGITEIVAMSSPECIVLPLEENEIGGSTLSQSVRERIEMASAISIGCGMRVGAGGAEFLREVFKTRLCPMVVDADALNTIAQWRELLGEIGPGAIVTPHPLEMARLSQKAVEEITENTVFAAIDFAHEHGVCVLLKGPRTVVCSPEGRLYINKTGNSALAKGGSGDILTGLIAGFAAQGNSIFTAAVIAAAMHGACADFLAETKSARGILPTDIVEALPEFMKKIGI